MTSQVNNMDRKMIFIQNFEYITQPHRQKKYNKIILLQYGETGKRDDLDDKLINAKSTWPTIFESQMHKK